MKKLIILAFLSRYLCCSRVSWGLWEGTNQGAIGRLHWAFLNGTPTPLPVWDYLWEPLPSRYDYMLYPHEFLQRFQFFFSPQPTPVQTTGCSKSSPSPTPTWMTWWLTTTRKLPAWRMCLRPTWGKALTHGSIFWNTTSQRDPAHCAVWEVNGGKQSTGVWNAPLGARSMSDCMWCPVLIFGTKPSDEKGKLLNCDQRLWHISPLPQKKPNIPLWRGWCIIFSLSLAISHFHTCGARVLWLPSD